MDTFFPPIIADELARTPWCALRHQIPSQPAPQHGEAPSTNAGGLEAANAAAAVALSDLRAVPPPRRPTYYKYANHLTEGVCLIITDTAMPGGFGGGVPEHSVASSPPSAASAYGALFCGCGVASCTATNRTTITSSSPSSCAEEALRRPVRAWVAQLRPDAMVEQLRRTFSHVQVAVPQLLRLVEAGLKAGDAATQLLPAGCGGGGGACSSSAAATSSPSVAPPFFLRIFLPISVAVSRGNSITLSLTIDAYCLEEVVAPSLRPSCYIDFVLRAVVQPMVRTQASLVAALTVLASRGSLRMEEFEGVFRHPIVAKTSAEATIGSAPTFWAVVTEAAMPPRPVPAPPPPPPVIAAAPAVGMPAGGPPTGANVSSACPPPLPPPSAPLPSSAPQHSEQNQQHSLIAGVAAAASLGPAAASPLNAVGSVGNPYAAPLNTAGGGVGVGPADTAAAPVGMKRVSSYVESPEESARRRALTEALAAGRQRQTAAAASAGRVIGVSATPPPPQLAAAAPLSPIPSPYAPVAGLGGAPAAAHTAAAAHRPRNLAAAAPPHSVAALSTPSFGGAPTPFPSASAAANPYAPPPPVGGSAASSVPQPQATPTTQPNAAQLKKVRKAML